MLIFPKCAVATLCFSSHILISASSTNENDLISQNSRSITMGKYDQVKNVCISDEAKTRMKN